VDNVVLEQEVAEPPVIEVQAAVTADAGISVQLVKLAGELALRFQVLLVLPPVVLKVTVAADDPATFGVVDGLLAVNVMVAGAAVSVVMFVAKGMIPTGTR